MSVRSVIAIPDAYAFNGFQALGPSGTPIGIIGLDFTMDSIPEITVPVLASDPSNYASVDVDLNGRYTDGIDPCLTMSQGGGVRFFDLTLPSDMHPLVSVFASAFEVTLTLYPGVLVNPRTPGMYRIEGMFTSVDPDTGGEDDTPFGTPPTVVNHMEELTVVPSAVSTLDPFVCYKASSSRGSICAANAPVNAGASCDGEDGCGGTVDVTEFCAKNRGPIGTPMLLDDTIETKAFEIKKSGALCSPGTRIGQTPLDPSTYLRGYTIKETKKSCVAGAAANPREPCGSDADCGGSACERTPRHVKQPALGIQNELGVTVVATKKVLEYRAPSAASSTTPVTPPGATAVDGYKCYGVKFARRRCAGDTDLRCKRDSDCGASAPCLRKFPKALSVSVEDTYTLGGKAFVLRKPTKLCLATDVDGAPAQSPTTHLLCYAVKALKRACTEATGVPGTACRNDADCLDFPVPDSCQEQSRTPKAKGLYVATALGVERLDRGKEVEICFPSMLQ